MNPDASGQADGLGGTVGLSRLLAAVRKSRVKGLASGPSYGEDRRLDDGWQGRV